MRLGLAAALLACLALAGCQSPMYSGTLDDLSPSHRDRSYIGAEPQAAEEHEPDARPTTEQQYEYRGGRDPVTGRARTQM
jgi:hypothetical protein